MDFDLVDHLYLLIQKRAEMKKEEKHLPQKKKAKKKKNKQKVR